MVGAEPGPLSPQASARPPLSRDSSQLPRVSSSERLQTGTPGKEKAKAQPVQLKPGHKVLLLRTCSRMHADSVPAAGSFAQAFDAFCKTH